MKTQLTQERLKDLLHYDPETGVFCWKVRKALRLQAGDIAGGIDMSEGYHKIKIDGQTLKGHRLAHLYMTGTWPEAQIDHINRDRADNRWSNLRQASSQDNTRNAKCYVTNSIGIKGVSYRPLSQVYIVRITNDGRTYYLGQVNCPREAAHAYNKAAIQLHGEFAVLNPI